MKDIDYVKILLYQLYMAAKFCQIFSLGFVVFLSLVHTNDCQVTSGNLGLFKVRFALPEALKKIIYFLGQCGVSVLSQKIIYSWKVIVPYKSAYVYVPWSDIILNISSQTLIWLLVLYFTVYCTWSDRFLFKWSLPTFRLDSVRSRICSLTHTRKLTKSI